MIFRNTQTGKRFHSIIEALDAECETHTTCVQCPMYGAPRNSGCFNYANNHYKETAELLGLEIIMERIGGADKTNKEEKKMTQERFESLVNEIREKSLDTLLKKNANYGSEDKLHNFRVGAAIIGGTPAQAALGYMAKHMASLIDKVQSNDFHDREDFLEKIQDSINYLVFIWCCGNEEMEKYTREAADGK